MAESNELLELFRSYNPDVWPLPVVAYVVGIGVLGLILVSPTRTVDRFAAGLLALLWLWLGVVFQGIYVRDVNPVLGVAYAALFIVEAALIARAGIVKRNLAFRPGANVATIIGGSPSSMRSSSIRCSASPSATPIQRRLCLVPLHAQRRSSLSGYSSSCGHRSRSTC